MIKQPIQSSGSKIGNNNFKGLGGNTNFIFVKMLTSTYKREFSDLSSFIRRLDPLKTLTFGQIDLNIKGLSEGECIRHTIFRMENE